MLLTTVAQLNASRYPVWASLARDYLAVMPTSVSSERAFSQGGLTISDRRTRLKADVVEALQFLKCSLRQDLLLQGTQRAVQLEEELEQEEPDPDPDTVATSSSKRRAPAAWDIILEDDDDDLEADSALNGHSDFRFWDDDDAAFGDDIGA